MPGLNNPLKEEIFPDFQPRPPLVQHELCLLRRVHIWINAVCNSFAVMERGCSHGHGAWNQRTQMTAVTYVSFVPWCLLQAGILMHLAPAQARLICILHLAEEVSMHSKTVKCWKFDSKWNKTIFFLSSLLLILLECPQQGKNLMWVCCRKTGHGATGSNKCRKFYLNMRKNFFTVWVTGHWYRLPKEGVEFALKLFRAIWDMTLSRWAWFIRGIGLDDLQSSLPTLAILQFCDPVVSMVELR